MPLFLHQPMADAPFEPYGGPPGRLDVADVVTAANSTTMAAGLCIAQGGPLVYRVDYDAVVIALDDDLVWEDSHGPQALKAGDVVWIAEGARNSYWSTGTSRFFYTTWPVNWAQIVGWEAGRDVKDLANQGGAEGSLSGIAVHRHAGARFDRFAADSGTLELAQLLGPGSGISMAAGLARFGDGALSCTAPCDMALVAIRGDFWIEAEGRGVEAAQGDLLWLAQGTPAHCGSKGNAVVGYVCAPADWANRIGWTPGTDHAG
jgi:ethanolamine utilization protein EutQ (cupin superfamily)